MPRRYQRESGAGRSAPRDPDAGQPDLASPGRSAPAVTGCHLPTHIAIVMRQSGRLKKIICYESCLLISYNFAVDRYFICYCEFS